MPDEDISQWPTLEETAAILKTSRRSLYRSNEAGELEFRKRTRPGKKPENVCNPNDVEKLKPAPYLIRQYRPEELQDRAPQIQAATPTRETTLDQFAVRLWEAIERARPPALPGNAPIAPVLDVSQLAQKLNLTLEEASVYSGYSALKLRHAIAAGRLTATKDGRRGAYIIRRASLESL